MTESQYAFGWRPDIPSITDYAYSAPRATLAALPAEVDLRPQAPPVRDQGSLGACTAFALTSAMDYTTRTQGKPFVAFSPLFTYFNERVMEQSVGWDSGAYIRDGAKSLAKQGACPEALWPYTIAQFTKKPPTKAYTAAMKHQAISYHRVPQTLTQMKGCLAEGFPFVLGFSVYESFMDAGAGIVPMPQPSEQLLGGHAVIAYGYTDKDQRFVLQNSWGPSWGEYGFFSLPYAYLLDSDLSADFWTIRLVETT